MVRSANSSVFWKVRRRPSRARWWIAIASMDVPAKLTWPLDLTKPHSASMSVVLPPPLGNQGKFVPLGGSPGPRRRPPRRCRR